MFLVVRGGEIWWGKGVNEGKIRGEYGMGK